MEVLSQVRFGSDFLPAIRELVDQLASIYDLVVNSCQKNVEHDYSAVQKGDFHLSNDLQLLRNVTTVFKTIND